MNYKVYNLLFDWVVVKEKEYWWFGFKRKRNVEILRYNNRPDRHTDEEVFSAIKDFCKTLGIKLNDKS